MPAFSALTLRAEANPDPAAPGEVVEVQIMVSSTSVSGNLTVRIPWPAGMLSSPWVTAGGGCSGSCSVGEFLTWNVGSLGAGETRLLAFNEGVLSAGTDGTTITFPIELLEGGSSVTTLDVDLDVVDDSPLEIVVQPLSDPVASGAQLVYEVVYGNNGSASAGNSELVFPIPAGTQFVAATGGGVHSGGSVTWNLGTVGPNSGSRERVTVQVDPLAGGSLLLVNAATVSGTVNFIPRSSRAMALSRVDSEALLLAAEVNPDPVAANELLETQITVTNSGGSASGNLSLRLWWPGEELFSSPWVTGAGGCSGSCSVGEYLFWDLGVLGPGISDTVSFNEELLSVASGSVIPFEIELLEAGKPARTVSPSVLVSSDSPLELTVDPLTDPAPSADQMTYELTYGNNGGASASSTVLTLPLPAGTSFVSATGGGVLSGGAVSWNLGDLAPNTGGRERVVVQVGALADGTLLEVDAASISGTVSFLPQATWARAVSRVGSGDIQLAVEMDPDPVNAGEMLEAQISVMNTGAQVSGDLSILIWWPGEEMLSGPWITGGGGCSGSCSPGEYLVWHLGPLGPGASEIVSFNEMTLSVPDGTLVQFEVELFEAGLPIRTTGHTVLIQSDSPLELAVQPLPDPVAPGAVQVYEIVWGNVGNSTADGATLTFPIPVGSTFQSATGGGVASGGTVSWSPGSLAPGSGGREEVSVQVDSLPHATLLEVDAAVLSAEISFQNRESRARAVSRVDTTPLVLEAVVTPKVIQQEELDAQIHVENPTGFVTGNLTLLVRWPGEELFASPVVTGGGGCSGSCSVGEYVFWDLGPLGPGASLDVGFSEDTLSVDDGTLIPIEIELFEAGLPARTYAETVLFHPFTDNDSDGEADVIDQDDDNDGMPDWWEVFYGLDPFDPADAGQDPDGDGQTNLQEFLAGTNPLVSSLIFSDGFESGNTNAWSVAVP